MTVCIHIYLKASRLHRVTYIKINPKQKIYKSQFNNITL